MRGWTAERIFTGPGLQLTALSARMGCDILTPTNFPANTRYIHKHYACLPQKEDKEQRGGGGAPRRVCGGGGGGCGGVVR
jgi:hypothetical protein